MKRLLFALSLIALPLAAQQVEKMPVAATATNLSAVAAQEAQAKTPPPSPPHIQKLFLLKYADPAHVANLLGVFNASVRPDSDMHALAVETTSEATMKAIDEAIQRLDVASAAAKNIEMTAYLLIGGEGAGTEPGVMPKEMDSVVAQLKNAFAFKSYRLLDTLVLRTRVGQRATSNSIGHPVQPGTQAPVTQFRISSAGIGSDETTVRIDGLNLDSRIPVATGQGQFSIQNVGLSADVDIKQGQKVVIGRVSVAESALFVVLTAQVVN